MNKEAVSAQQRILDRFNQIYSDIKQNGVNSSGDYSLFFANEDIALLKHLLGEKNSDYNKVVALKDKIEQLVKNGDSAAEFY